jgi:hypothetical protein
MPCKDNTCAKSRIPCVDSYGCERSIYRRIDAPAEDGMSIQMLDVEEWPPNQKQLAIVLWVIVALLFCFIAATQAWPQLWDYFL